MLGRKEKRQKQVRLEAISAADEFLKKEGIAALTIRKLAENIGYSPAALYEYFPSKEHILVALRQNIFKKQLKQLKRINSNTDPKTYFKKICIEMLHFRLLPENYQVMFLQLPKDLLEQVVSNELIELREFIDSALQRLDSPLLKTVSQRQFAIFIIRSHLEGIVHLFLRGEMTGELNCPEENTKKFVDILIKSWSTQ